MDWTTTRKRLRTSVAAGCAAAVIGSSLLATSPAVAANEDIGYPTFTGSPTPVPATGTTYTPGNQLQAILDADLAAGAGDRPRKDFWVDRDARTHRHRRRLRRHATSGCSRAAARSFMKTHTPGTLGFGGEVAYMGRPSTTAARYTITAQVGGANVTLTEDTAQRKQTPSYWRSVHRHAASGVEIVQTKFITDANVARHQPRRQGDRGRADGHAARGIPVRHDRRGAGAHRHRRRPQQPHHDLPAPLRRRVRRRTARPSRARSPCPPAAAPPSRCSSASLTDEIPASRTEYEPYRAATPAAAFATQVTAYNQWWADNIPYLDTPEDNIDKTLFYRWWLMRFNFLDADIPGNDYQFPTSMEGVLGYNNAIVLTIGMFIDDLKYFRDPIYSYGPWVSAGEDVEELQVRRQPGRPGELVQQLHAVHLRGGVALVPAARRARRDRREPRRVRRVRRRGPARRLRLQRQRPHRVQLGRDDGQRRRRGVVRLARRQHGPRRERVPVLQRKAAADGVPRRGQRGEGRRDGGVRARTSRSRSSTCCGTPSRQPARAPARRDNGEHVPWKEINNYYPYTVGLMPKPGDADYADDYVEALRLFADDERVPDLPVLHGEPGRQGRGRGGRATRAATTSRSSTRP